MTLEIILPYVAVIAALALVWPRGYLLVYLIDRTKSFRFGFKFFVGWIFGASGFTLDLFAAQVVGGQPLVWWVILGSAVSQIIGFSAVIFLFERRLVLPRVSRLLPFFKASLRKILAWTIVEKIALVVILMFIFVVGAAVFQGVLKPQSDDASLAIIKNYPVSYNDILLKVSVIYVSAAAGEFVPEYLGLVGIFYYLILFGAFYFMLPIQLPRLLRLGSMFALLAGEAMAWLGGGVDSAVILPSFFLLLAIASLFYYLAGAGLSFFYLALMALAFTVWSNIEALIFIFPAVLLATLILALTRRVLWRHFGLSWFFAVLTLAPWLYGDQAIYQKLLADSFLSEHLLTPRGGELFVQALTASAAGSLWLVMLAFILLWYKKIWRQYPLLFLTALTLVLRVTAALYTLNATPIFFNSLALQLNVWFLPLVIFTLTFYFHDLFGRLRWYDKKISH